MEPFMVPIRRDGSESSKAGLPGLTTREKETKRMENLNCWPINPRPLSENTSQETCALLQVIKVRQYESANTLT